MLRPHSHTAFLRQTRTKQRLAILAVLLIALYVFVPQVGSLSSGWEVLRSASLPYVVAGFAVMLLSYPLAAITYTVLAYRRLRYARTVLVQLSGAFVNRLLPAGIGGMGLNAQYLTRSGYTLSEAVTVVGTNNAVGAAAGMLLMAVVILSGGASVRELHLSAIGLWWYVTAVALAVMAGCLLLVGRWRGRIRRARAHIRRVLLGYRSQPWRLVVALASSLGLAMLHVVVLWCAGQAVGLSLPVAAYVVIFSVGTFVGAASPTPGGLVGMEAGLTAVLVAYGVAPGTALAAALLYRLLTFWLPLGPGFIAFLSIRGRLGF